MERPATLPFQGLSGPTLAVHDNKLYIFCIRPSDRAVMWASMGTSGNWTTPPGSPPTPAGTPRA